MLASYGIETAWDVSQANVRRVPGFGEKLTKNMLAWRRTVESRFQYDPSKGLDPADVAAVERDIAARRRDIERQLLAGPAELESLRERVLMRRGALRDQIRTAYDEMRQAMADLDTVQG